MQGYVLAKFKRDASVPPEDREELFFNKELYFDSGIDQAQIWFDHEEAYTVARRVRARIVKVDVEIKPFPIPPLSLKEPDPELEALLAEEEAIAARQNGGAR